MNIVVLCGPVFPRMAPPTSCIYKYLEALSKSHKVTILCQRLTYIEEPTLDNIRIIQVSNWINDVRIWSTDNLSKKKLVILSKLVYFFTRLYGAIISYFVIPTRNSWLINKYQNALYLVLKKESVDCLISVSSPPCAHIAAMHFKLRNPRVKWLTYFTDPFTYYESLYKNVLLKEHRKRKLYLIEKNIYDNADYNILTEELYSLAISEFGQDSRKTICFPYVINSLEVYMRDYCNINQLPRLIYAGALREGIRNPEFALSIISKMNGIEFDIFQAGDTLPTINKYKTDFINIYGLVSRDEYLDKICNEYDILVNIGNVTSLQAPSKLMELISTGKPVVNFYVNKDSQYRAIELYPLGINIGKDTLSPVKKLSDFCMSNKGKRLAFSEIYSLFPNNNYAYQFELLNKMISNSL